MPARVLNIILNPTSGGGRSLRRMSAIEHGLAAHGARAVFHQTRAPRHGAELAFELATRGDEWIVAAGGDGTIHDVANGLLRAPRGPALGVLPLGTGNDFAKVVPGARKLPGALATLVRGIPAAYDAGHATWPGGDEFFVNGMGTGIDVEVVRQIQRLPRLPGPVKYLAGLFRALAVYKPVRISAQLGERCHEHTVMMMAVGNGVCQGGGFYLTPHAAPADGRLELCIIDSIPLWRVPVVLPLVLRGTHAGHRAVSMHSFECVRFESTNGAPLFFQLDGELREPARAHNLTAEVRKAALNVITDTDSKE